MEALICIFSSGLRGDGGSFNCCTGFLPRSWRKAAKHLAKPHVPSLFLEGIEKQSRLGMVNKNALSLWPDSMTPRGSPSPSWPETRGRIAPKEHRCHLGDSTPSLRQGISVAIKAKYLMLQIFEGAPLPFLPFAKS